MTSDRQPNRLKDESSLYLRQHAQNPVDWFPWGAEAIAKAKAERKPIFLSIGYSACHWCHVMAHESFEDEATAAYLNEHFVCIKVDREERPDIDTIYMSALQAMTREGGGWPLSVWLTPDLHPFYAGTYFPPDNRYAPHRPSFRGILAALVEAWENRRADILEKSGQVVDYLKTLTPQSDSAGGELSVEMLKQVCDALVGGIDKVQGGFGRAPKFPHALELRLLLRGYDRFKVPAYLEAVELTLQKMAKGGIYDQIGGGFHRYSVDAQWLTPHFEKMLYDNALLVPAYLEAWQITKNPFYAEIARETLDYVLREMTSPSGGFYSAQDADSEGEEGKFYVWSLAEIEEVLGAEDGKWFADAYDITTHGNFEGHNIPNRNGARKPLPDHLEDPVLRERLRNCKAKLLEVRSKRIWPGRDEKILTAWNGLMISAFALAGSVLQLYAFEECLKGNPDPIQKATHYSETASKAARFIQSKSMYFIDGPSSQKKARLFRTCSEDTQGKIDGFLEDYAFVGIALLDLFRNEPRMDWLNGSKHMAYAILELFWDTNDGGFFFTTTDKKDLISRTKELHDGSTPAGNSVATMLCSRLGMYPGNLDYDKLVNSTLKTYGSWMVDNPGAAGQLLMALDYQIGPRKQLVLVGHMSTSSFHEAFTFIMGRFEPRTEIFHRFIWPANEKNEERYSSLLETLNRGMAWEDPGMMEIFEGRDSIDGQITLYICENFTCSAPIVGLESIKRAMLSLSHPDGAVPGIRAN